MDGHTHESGGPIRRRATWQFSLLTLVLLSACAAAAVALLWTLPTWVAGPTLLLVATVLPTGLGLAALYRTGALRAFCIGALVPAGFHALAVFLYVFIGILEGHTWAQRQPSDWLNLVVIDGFTGALRLTSAIAWTVSLLTGLASIGMRRLLVKRPHGAEHSREGCSEPDVEMGTNALGTRSSKPGS